MGSTQIRAGNGAGARPHTPGIGNTWPARSDHCREQTAEGRELRLQANDAHPSSLA